MSAAKERKRGREDGANESTVADGRGATASPSAATGAANRSTPTRSPSHSTSASAAGAAADASSSARATCSAPGTARATSIAAAAVTGSTVEAVVDRGKTALTGRDNERGDRGTQDLHRGLQAHCEQRSRVWLLS